VVRTTIRPVPTSEGQFMISFRLIGVVFASIFFLRATPADVVMGRGVPTPSDIDKAIESDPNNADLYNIRGNKYLISKQYNKAILDFNKAIQINPNYKEPYNGLGIAYRNMNDFERAIENYTKALTIDPSYFEAYNNRGVAYMFLENYKNMCSDFWKACNLGSCEKLFASTHKRLCK
jgi:lipoprotein NlpI